MQHSIQTLLNGRIILMDIVGDLLIEEWNQLCTEVMTMISADDESVHILLDQLKMNKHPVNVVKIKRATKWLGDRRVASLSHMTTDRFVNILGETVISLSIGSVYKCVPSLQEACDHIMNLDPTISTSPDELLARLEAEL